MSCLVRAPSVWLNSRPWPAFSGIQRRRIFVVRRVQTQSTLAAESADELQAQLSSLMDEAGAARKRADKARARFMRLTEAVEQMSLRAAADMKAGNEGAARQLLLEKKNVMCALEQAKKRAELLEEFASKLNEVISKKETRLIASLSWTALNLDSSQKNSSDVRIVSPKEEEGELTEDESSKEDQVSSDSSTDSTDSTDPEENLRFQRYMLEIDTEIAATEERLEQFLDVASMLSSKRLSDERVIAVEQILQDLRQARSRISKITGQ